MHGENAWLSRVVERRGSSPRSPALQGAQTLQRCGEGGLLPGFVFVSLGPVVSTLSFSSSPPPPVLPSSGFQGPHTTRSRSAGPTFPVPPFLHPDLPVMKPVSYLSQKAHGFPSDSFSSTQWHRYLFQIHCSPTINRRVLHPASLAGRAFHFPLLDAPAQLSITFILDYKKPRDVGPGFLCLSTYLLSPAPGSVTSSPKNSPSASSS